MAEPKASRKTAAARLKAAEKVLDDLFKEIRENTARARHVREGLPGKAPRKPDDETEPSTDEKK